MGVGSVLNFCTAVFAVFYNSLLIGVVGMGAFSLPPEMGRRRRAGCLRRSRLYLPLAHTQRTHLPVLYTHMYMCMPLEHASVKQAIQKR